MNQLPESFVTRLKSERPLVAKNILSAIEEGKPGTSIRVNPDKPFLVPCSAERIPWADNGYFLQERGSFITDPLWHAGAYYVQEASSMLIELAIKQYAPVSACKALDLCAAPGGKTTHLASLLSKDSLIIANEVIQSRSNILSQNIKQWGNPNVYVTNNDPKHFAAIGGFFDLVLVDAPCSGEGMFRKDIRAAAEWSEANVSLCASRQKRILTDAWDALAPGGLLLYSTCTFNSAENEENMDFLQREKNCNWLELNLDGIDEVTEIEAKSGVGYACYPGITRGEGFFLAIARKRNSAQVDSAKRNKKKKIQKSNATIPSAVKELILNTEDYIIETSTSTPFLVKKCHVNDLLHIKSRLKFKKHGLFLGEQKGNNFIPSHELATSTLLNIDGLAKEELTLEQANLVLTRRTFRLKSEEKGIHIVTHNGVPFAFMKHLGNRSNNLFPSALRVLKQLDADKLWSIVLS